MKMKLTKNKLIFSLALFILISSICYKLFIKKESYSLDYDTTAIILNTNVKEDEYSEYTELKLEYKNSENNKVVSTYKIYNDESDKHKKLKMYNINIGSQIKIRTEETFYEGIFDKKYESSSVMDIILYNEKEIQEAKNVVKQKFESEFDGCLLTSLWYDENLTMSLSKEISNQYNKDEVIILLSNFEVDSFGGDGSLNPNETYNNWQWILVKDNDKWEVKTYGY